MTLVLLAQRNPDDEAKPLPDRYWRDRRDKIIQIMRQQANGAK